MKKQKNPIKIVFKTLVLTLVIGLVVGMSFLPANKTHAATVDELRAQNAALQEQINVGNAKAQELAKQADSLQNQLAIFDLQISQLQAQIDLTQGKINELQLSLDKAQADLEHQKELLKASLTELYKRGGASTVELLIGSDSFSQFINNQTYLEKLKSGIQTSAEKVIVLKQQIQSEQTQQKNLLAQQQGQQQVLVGKQNEQQALLDQTQGQESSYRQVVASLRQQQLAILAQIATSNQQLPGDGTRGGYPVLWANSEQDTIIDSWGMFNRECVSYTAFKVSQSGRHMPTNWPSYYNGYEGGGNAKDWLYDASIDGIPYNNNPQAGDVAIATFAPWGHAMYVEAVSGRSIYVSQYNLVHGQYSEMWINLDSPGFLGSLSFIHFP
jgi:peptidoglycan hydrolase CwlO-like protein